MIGHPVVKPVRFHGAVGAFHMRHHPFGLDVGFLRDGILLHLSQSTRGSTLPTTVPIVPMVSAPMGHSKRISSASSAAFFFFTQKHHVLGAVHPDSQVAAFTIIGIDLLKSNPNGFCWKSTWRHV